MTHYMDFILKAYLHPIDDAQADNQLTDTESQHPLASYYVFVSLQRD